MFSLIFAWLLGLAQHLNYLTIGSLMAIESSFVPLPSELIIPPAAYLASLGHLNVVWIVVVGVIGSVVGSSINYLIAMWLGRLVIFELANRKWARFFLVTPEKLLKAEKDFLKSANSATFVSRLIPVARHLISIPAGFCGMPYGSFVLYTALGSTIWVSILAALGYFLGANQALLHRYAELISWSLLAVVILWLAWIILRKKLRSKKII